MSECSRADFYLKKGPKNLTAAYIEDLVREMEALAAKEKIKPLCDLLRRAKEEARRTAQTRGSEGGACCRIADEA